MGILRTIKSQAGYAYSQGNVVDLIRSIRILANDANALRARNNEVKASQT